MIEWLGVGVRGRDQLWIIRGVSARLDAPELTAVVSADAAARHTMLDAATGRAIAEEGRVWVGGVPVMPDTRRRVRSLLAEIAFDECPQARRLPPVDPRRGRWARFVRFVKGTPSREPDAVRRMLRHVGLDAADGRVADAEREGVDERHVAGAKARLARVLVTRPDQVLVRDVDTALTEAAAADFLTALRRIVHAERVGAVFTCRSLALAHAHADRLLVLGNARVLIDGVPGAADERVDSDRPPAPLTVVR